MGSAGTSGTETVALYTIHLVRHWPPRGHGVELGQLHVFAGVGAGGGDRILALCEAIICPMFCIQLYETFTFPLLNSFE